MSPAYGSQVTSNSPLQAVTPDQVVPATLFSAETPVAAEASLAVALMPRTPTGQLTPVAVRFSCPGGVGAGVFQIQTADFDAAAEYVSEPFNGASPGTVAAANFNANGVARVELIVRARFLRVLCTTAPSNPVTVTVE
jgi:hypothetical protein